MSLVKTLARAAIGIAVAKGMGSLMGGGQARAGSRSGGGFGGGLGGRGSSYGGPVSRGGAAGGGNITDVLGQLLGGDGPRGRGSLGGALEELSRISTGSLSGSGGVSGLGEASQRFDKPSQGSFGDLLNQSLDHYGEPASAPSAADEKLAGVLLRALIQAAKADGQIDAGEKKLLTEQLGDLDQSELAFVNGELEKPVDAAALARDVPKGAEAQVYMMSVMAIDLDTKQEAQYLHELAQALGISPEAANQIHDRMGEPRIFR